MLLYPSSSLPSNSSVAVSSKSEDSALSAHLFSKLSTLTASLAASMATQQQVASAQSLQASLVKLQELNARNDVREMSITTLLFPPCWTSQKLKRGLIGGLDHGS